MRCLPDEPIATKTLNYKKNCTAPSISSKQFLEITQTEMCRLPHGRRVKSTARNKKCDYCKTQNPNSESRASINVISKFPNRIFYFRVGLSQENDRQRSMTDLFRFINNLIRRKKAKKASKYPNVGGW